MGVPWVYVDVGVPFVQTSRESNRCRYTRVMAECTLSVPWVYLGCTLTRVYLVCRRAVRVMRCRYTRVLAECSQVAAEWQLMFTHHATNTFPNVYQYVVHPGTDDVTHIANCDQFWPGLHVLQSPNDPRRRPLAPPPS